MLEEILQEMNNWFVREVHTGQFTVEDGRLTLPFLQDGQYFRIVGSVFNDGLHKYPAEGLDNESFEGAVWALAVPKAVISLAEEVSTWKQENAAALNGVFQSESLRDYSYSKATGKDGKPLTWKDVFGSRLSEWRKI